MQVTRIDDKVSVSGQLTPADMAEAAAAGFRAVVCNRPDGEAPDQPPFAEIAAAAAAAGLTAHYIPMGPTIPVTDQVARMAEVVAAAGGPVLAYCRSGARSTNLYAAARDRG